MYSIRFMQQQCIKFSRWKPFQQDAGFATDKFVRKVKKPPTPFFLYCMEAKKSQESTVKPQLHVSNCGRKWREMNEDDKKPYVDKYHSLHEEYKTALNNLSDEELEEIKFERKARLAAINKLREKRTTNAERIENGRPQKPASSYNLFLQSYFRTNNVGDGRSTSERVKEIARKWKEMSPDERKPYQDEALKLKQRYDDDMEKFAERMWSEGKHEMIPSYLRRRFAV